MDTELIDIAIIGAGVSGVYSAWKLKLGNPKWRVVVFEGSGRVGGRLLSVRPPDIPNMVAELGGMRILPEVQPRIRRLIGDLNENLPAGQQIELYDFPVDEPQNIAYLRGVHLRNADFSKAPHKVPYQLSFVERGGMAGNVILNAIEQIVPGITDTNLDEEQRRLMCRRASFAGKPLNEQGFWNVLLRVISGEAYQLGVDAGGYNSTLVNWNAADAIPWYLSDFGVNARYKGFKRGFQEVPKTLGKLFVDAGGELRLNTKLEGFDWVDGAWDLQVGGQRIRAKSLILAMPRRSLDMITPTSAPLQDPEVQRLISSVTPRPLFKFFATYNNPWWLAAGYCKPDGTFVPVRSGRSVTDLPIRQAYYWPKDDGTPATGGPSMLLASYDDGDNIGFWDGLRPRRSESWRLGKAAARLQDPFVGTAAAEADGELEWNEHVAPRRMVEEVARQLATIHGLTHTPRVQNAAFRDWGEDPYGGGWNSWNIGVKSWEVKRQIIKPLEEKPLYICGEAYSDAQGWVEGALQTADMMLEKIGFDTI